MGYYSNYAVIAPRRYPLSNQTCSPVAITPSPIRRRHKYKYPYPHLSQYQKIHHPYPSNHLKDGIGLALFRRYSNFHSNYLMNTNISHQCSSHMQHLHRLSHLERFGCSPMKMTPMKQSHSLTSPIHTSSNIAINDNDPLTSLQVLADAAKDIAAYAQISTLEMIRLMDVFGPESYEVKRHYNLHCIDLSDTGSSNTESKTRLTKIHSEKQNDQEDDILLKFQRWFPNFVVLFTYSIKKECWMPRLGVIGEKRRR